MTQCGKCLQDAAIKAGKLKPRKGYELLTVHYHDCPLRRKERKAK